MNKYSLDDLVPDGDPPTAGTLDRDTLRRRAAAVAAYVAGQGSGWWLLHEPDPGRFAACLYGVLLGGGDVTLLPDVRPGTLAAVDASYTGHLGLPVDAERHVSLDTIASASEPVPRMPEVVPGEVTVLTSGTTGERKQLARGPDELLAEAAALQQRWPLDGRILVASMVSHHHMYGLAFGIVWPLACSAQLLTAKQSPVPDFATLDNSAARKLRLVTSPTYLHRFEASLGLANFQDRDGRDVAIECAFSAGSPLDPDKAAVAAEHWCCPVNEIYGSSETGAVATRRADIDTAWEVLPGAVVRVEDERLLIDAPYLAKNLPCPFVSPDRVEPVGASFRLLGRADRVVKVEGKRVSLQQIEDTVQSLGWVDACAAVLLDGGRSQIGLAVVPGEAGCMMLHRHGKAALDRQMREALARELEAVMLPRRIRYLAEVPATAEGKVESNRLRAAFDENARRRPTVHAVAAKDEGVELDLALDPDLLAFEGHFPERRILPGVALLHWVLLLAHDNLKTPLHAGVLPSIKFMKILAPKERLQLSLARKASHVEYVCTRAGVTASKGRIRFDE